MDEDDDGAIGRSFEDRVVGNRIDCDGSFVHSVALGRVSCIEKEDNTWQCRLIYLDI